VRNERERSFGAGEGVAAAGAATLLNDERKAAQRELPSILSFTILPLPLLMELGNSGRHSPAFLQSKVFM
jgi:hypothetical protein